MKKCKNPQCLTQISENAPDFCPDHNPHPHTHKEEPRSWEEGLMDEFCMMFERATDADDITDWPEKLESFISNLLSTREKEVRVGVSMLRQWLNEDRIDDPKKMVTNEDIMTWLTPKTEIR